MKIILPVVLKLCLGVRIESWINDDRYSVKSQSIKQVLKTQEEIPEQIQLETVGMIPDWINGNLYRNGPGKFEFGNDSFSHLFDPAAIIQKLNFSNGRVEYQSKYLKSRNFKTNQEMNRIIFPELGTAAEPDWVNTDENGLPLTEDEIVSTNTA